MYLAQPSNEYILSRISTDDCGCWIWQLKLNPQGYGTCPREKGGQGKAYRLSYETFVGPIAHGLSIDHLCRNKACVNPLHLEAVTHRVNVLRGIGPSAKQARQTHCRNGHELSGNNIYKRKDGKRTCITCANEYNRINNRKYYLLRRTKYRLTADVNKLRSLRT